MKYGFFLFMLLPVAAHVYVLWHVYQVLPLPVWAKWCVVALMIAALAMMIVGLIVFLYLLIAFLALDLGRLVHLIPKQWLHDNAWTACALTAVIAALLIGGNILYRIKVREPLSLHTDKTLS